jgi:hypothetical protein
VEQEVSGVTEGVGEGHLCLRESALLQNQGTSGLDTVVDACSK